MTHVPAVVFIGPADYTIRQKKKFDLLGETEPNDSEITLRRKQSDSSKRNTLMHEVLHAIVWESGYRHVGKLTYEKEERLVSMLSPWILAFLQDNPDALRYLLSKGAGE